MKHQSNSAFTFEARSLRSNRKKPIEVFVSAGSFSAPYYTFKDKKGRQIESFELNPSKQYRLKRANKASTHPFYISDQGWNQPATNKIKLKGDGDFDSGIIGAEKFTLSIKKRHQKEFTTSGRLFFYCTSHQSMFDNFIINASTRKQRQRNSDESFTASKQSIEPEHLDHPQPTTKANAFPLISPELWTKETTSSDSDVAILNIRP